MTLVAIAAAAFWITDLCKLILPWPMQSWTKHVLAGAVATALAVWLSSDVQTAVTTALGAAGLAAGFHRLHRMMGRIGDEKQTAVMMRAGRRPI